MSTGEQPKEASEEIPLDRKLQKIAEIPTHGLRERLERFFRLDPGVQASELTKAEQTRRALKGLCQKRGVDASHVEDACQHLEEQHRPLLIAIFHQEKPGVIPEEYKDRKANTCAYYVHLCKAAVRAEAWLQKPDDSFDELITGVLAEDNSQQKSLPAQSRFIPPPLPAAEKTSKGTAQEASSGDSSEVASQALKDLMAGRVSTAERERLEKKHKAGKAE